MQLSELIKSSGKYDLVIFSPEAINRVEQNIFTQKDKYFIKCLKRKKNIQARPEEINYNAGYQRLLDLANDPEHLKTFNFDIVMTNPPFAGDIPDSRLIAGYNISSKGNNKYQTKVSRDILFIERNLDFLADGGRMAVVLPNSRLNNISDKSVREFIMARARLIAIVGLDSNTFKPHTSTKTSVLFVQKWHDELNPYQEDYPIFMAVSQNSGKDNSGEEIYETNQYGQRILDEHNHLVQKHDLAKIANAFKVWVKEQNLSFWK